MRYLTRPQLVSLISRAYLSCDRHLCNNALVECKTSRADFLADQAKPHRQAGGVGNWRYYMAPEGIISVHELPDKWGLVEVNHRGHMKTVVGPFTAPSYQVRRERLVAAWHPSDTQREFFLVVRLFGVVAQMPVAAEVGSGDERDELGSG